MSPIREDPELAVPEPPDSIPPLDDDQAGLALAGPAGPGGWLVEGGTTVVAGSRNGPIERIDFAGRAAVRRVEAHGSAVANLVAWPAAVRRERVGPRGTATETVVASPTVPLVAVQYGPGAAREVTLEVPLEGDVRYAAGRRALIAERAEGTRVVLGCTAGATLAVTASPGGLAVRVVVGDSAGDAATLLVAAGPADRCAAAFRAAPHLAAHARLAREAELDSGLTVRTGSSLVDDGVAWARWRLRAALARAAEEPGRRGTDGGGEPVTLWAALAALAVCDRTAAEHGLRVLGGEHALDGALVAARHATAFGDAAAARTAAGRLLDATPPDVDRAELGPVLETLAECLHRSAPEALVKRLKEAARASLEPVFDGPRHVPRTAATPLPMVGRGAGARARWLRAVTSGDPPEPGRFPSAGPGAPTARLAYLARSDPDTAWLQWVETADAGLTTGTAGPGSWDAPDPVEGALAPSTSAMLVALAWGVLGLSLDVPVGRLRIAPRLPAAIGRMRVCGLALGRGTELALDYERDGRAHRFTVEPVRAAVPPTVVLEPSIAGEVGEVLVDDARADLQLRADGSRTLVPVQIAIDAPRRIEILTT